MNLKLRSRQGVLGKQEGLEEVSGVRKEVLAWVVGNGGNEVKASILGWGDEDGMWMEKFISSVL